MNTRLALAFVACLVAAPAVAQTPPKPPFPIQGWIDGPYSVTPTGFAPVTFTPDVPIVGWTFDCRTGDQVPFITVSELDLTTFVYSWVTDYRVIRGQVRTDVQKYFLPTCQNAGANTGYSVYLPTKLSPGRHFIAVWWTTGDGYTQSQMVYVTVPAS